MKLTRCKCVGRHTYTLNCNSFPFFHTYELILHFTPLRSRTRENYQHNHESEEKDVNGCFASVFVLKLLFIHEHWSVAGGKIPHAHDWFPANCFIIRAYSFLYCLPWQLLIELCVNSRIRRKSFFSTFSHAPNRTNVEAVGSVYGVAGNFSLFVHSPRSCAIGVIKFCVRHSHSNSRQKKNNFSSDRSN